MEYPRAGDWLVTHSSELAIDATACQALSPRAISGGNRLSRRSEKGAVVINTSSRRNTGSLLNTYLESTSAPRTPKGFIGWLIRQSGMKKNEVAQKIGVSPASVIQQSLGNRSPSREVWKKYANLFGFSYEDLALWLQELKLTPVDRKKPSFQPARTLDTWGKVVHAYRMKADRTAFAHLLSEKRTLNSKHLSLSDISQLTGLGANFISFIENDRAMGGVKTIAILSAALKIPASDLSKHNFTFASWRRKEAVMNSMRELLRRLADAIDEQQAWNETAQILQFEGHPELLRDVLKTGLYDLTFRELNAILSYLGLSFESILFNRPGKHPRIFSIKPYQLTLAIQALADKEGIEASKPLRLIYYGSQTMTLASFLAIHQVAGISMKSIVNQYHRLEVKSSAKIVTPNPLAPLYRVITSRA